MGGSVFEEKSSFKMLGLSFPFKLIWGSYIISVKKTASRKIAALKSTIQPCMEYCSHAWAGVSNCYSEMLDKLQKRIYQTVGPSLAPFLEPLAHCWNEAILSLFWFHFVILEGGFFFILIDCMNFLPPFLYVRRISTSTVSFLA